MKRCRRAIWRWDWFDWLCVQVATLGMVGILALAALLAHGLQQPAAPSVPSHLMQWRPATPDEVQAWQQAHEAATQWNR